jgi:hypothetical protein
VGQSYVIAATGPWIFGNKVMLPAGVIDRIDVDVEKVGVNRAKDQIKARRNTTTRWPRTPTTGRRPGYRDWDDHATAAQVGCRCGSGPHRHAGRERQRKLRCAD